MFAPILCAVPFRKNKIETKDKKKKKEKKKGKKGGEGCKAKVENK